LQRARQLLAAFYGCHILKSQLPKPKAPSPPTGVMSTVEMIICSLSVFSTWLAFLAGYRSVATKVVRMHTMMPAALRVEEVGGGQMCKWT